MMDSSRYRIIRFDSIGLWIMDASRSRIIRCDRIMDRYRVIRFDMIGFLALALAERFGFDYPRGAGFLAIPLAERYSI